MPPVASVKVDHIVLLARSMERSLPYYAALLDTLGFTKIDTHFWRNDHAFIVQLNEARPETSGYERYGPGVNHLGLRVETAAEVEAVQRAMRERGFDAPEIQDLDGVQALFMKDPDGLRIEISHFPPHLDLAQG